MHDWVAGAAWAVLLYAGLTLLQVALRKRDPLRRMPLSINALFLAGSVRLFLMESVARIHPNARGAVQTAFLACAAFVIIRLFDLLLFEVVLGRRRRRPVPVVLRDILRWIAWIAAVFIIIRALFPAINLNVLAVSSIVVGYILGNATQDTLGNLIAGLALNTESPFSIGDWVKVGDHTGQVVDMTWRATCLRTKAHDHILIPNAAIAREPIVNYSRPSPVHALTVSIGVSYEVPPNKVRQVLLGVLAREPKVLRTPAPRVRITNYGDFAINYDIKFFLDDFAALEDIHSDLFNAVWYAFKRENIVIPFPIRDLRWTGLPAEALGRTPPPPDYRAMVARVGLFRALTDEQRDVIARSLQPLSFAEGEVLVREGDAGQTFYLVESGRVRVDVARLGRPQTLARLGEGEFFGETSLLTGAPRSATVTAECDTHVLALQHTVMGDLLRNNAALADILARELERRQADRREALTREQPDAPAPPAESHSALLARICRFFGL